MTNEELDRLNRRIEGLESQHAMDSRTLREYAAQRDALRAECASWKEMYHAEKARIEGAPTAECEAPVYGEYVVVHPILQLPKSMIGKRVALVVLEDGES